MDDENVQQIKCGSPKHAERSDLPGWSDEVLVEIRNAAPIVDNPYRCEACGRLLKEEFNADLDG